MALETCERPLCIRGYHIYKEIWTAAIGEVLPCEREPTNPEDRYAVAVKKDDIIVGHLPRKVSRICTLFLRRGGSITCTVAGSRRYSQDLPQGGLEIPCDVKFEGKSREIQKVKHLFKKTNKVKSL